MLTQSKLSIPSIADSTSGEATGALVISLDFELRWGTCDQQVPAGAPQLLNARDVVYRLLDMFQAREVSATWATVGFLFAENRDELHHFAPELLPTYTDKSLNPYRHSIGRDEQDDPLHFAPSLIRAIQTCPGQEIGTHTFSHYYCLEPGQTKAQFSNDLRSACALARARGIEIGSIVFPRNQVNVEHLDVLKEHGIHCFRGTSEFWLHTASDFSKQRLPYKRLLRLADAYLPLFGDDVVDWPVELLPGLYNSPASRYFRPYTSSLGWLATRALKRIKRGMELAALRGRVYHLWFHPEDFGLYPDENLDLLASVLDCFCDLRDAYGMRSLSMAAAATSREAQTESRLTVGVR